MKTGISSLAFLIILYLGYKGFKEYEKQDIKIKEYVGTTVRVNDEKHYIIDYSVLYRTYTLDNNTKISIQFVLNE